MPTEKEDQMRSMAAVIAVSCLAAMPGGDVLAQGGAAPKGGPVCAFSGPPEAIPVTAKGSATVLDWKSLGSPAFIRVVGCGGGGGGAGASRAPNDGYAPSGAGGAGTRPRSYLFGPIVGSTDLEVRITGDGVGGCGGLADAARCPTLKSGSAKAPNEGQPGGDGVSVKIGNMTFNGGQGGTNVLNWTWWNTNPSSVAHGGQFEIRGGNGGTANVADPTPGESVAGQKGGAYGARPTDGAGSGGIPGGGGGASHVADGGRGGQAGSGDGKVTGAKDNAASGDNGGICAGGGGGGGAAGGTFPGGNGGRGGQGWIIIFSYKTDATDGSSKGELFPGDLKYFGQPCPLPASK